MAEYTREQLEHSKPLDLNLILSIDEGGINKVVDEVYSQLSLEPHNKNKAINNLKCIILNLVNHYEEDKFLFTAIHLNEKKYIANRYNKNKITKAICKLPEILDKAGYIYFHKGIRYPHLSRISRILPLPKLLQLVKSKGVNPDLITHRPDTETVINQKKIKVRGSKNKIKEDIPYQDNNETRSFRKLMVDYNNLLNETHIDVLNIPKSGIRFGNSKYPVKINQNKKFMRRIFNSKDFSEGGRIYGGFWQQLNSEWRSRIMIDSFPTTEVDYSGLGIQTIYDKYEIPKNIEIDAYDLEPVGYDYGKYSYKELRPLLKYALMIMLNSSNYGVSLYAIRDKIRKDDELPRDINLVELIEAFTKRHEPISQYFYKSMGGIQYRIDSEICAKIISYFLYEIQKPSMARIGFQLSKQALLKDNPKLKGMMFSDGKERTWDEVEAIMPEYEYGGVPILTVHDSFVIDAKYEEILKWQMEAQYKLELGVKFNKPVPTKTEWKEQAKEKHMETAGVKWDERVFKTKEEALKGLKELSDKNPETKGKEPIEISIDNIAPQVRDEEISWDTDYTKRFGDWDKGKDKLWVSNYYKLEEEPEEFIYKNKWHYIEPNKE